MSSNVNKYEFLFTRFANKIIGEEIYTQLNGKTEKIKFLES